MEHTSSERSSLEIRPSCAGEGAAIVTNSPRNDDQSNPYPEIRRIALEIGKKSRTVSRTTESTAANSDESTLDPNTPAFIPRQWVENILRSANNTSWKSRQTYLILKKVDILGADYTEEEQENVISILLLPFRIRTWQRNIPRRILRNIDGFLQPGQMLLVLGRPGSGCSSLLKTIGGELGRLTLGENSVLHYNGEIPHT
jgi:ABC-type glutathione transport system ATPase component